jgi:transcriptional regulator with XRE-family HTH domain
MDYSHDHKMGENIRKIREKKGLTQEQLAAKLQTLGCDITRSALAKIEAGQRHLYSWEIPALKNALDVTFEDLFV